mmetsp:Transcript_14676/g.31899  ORF Transcript_14676/g.31899 Transcript_14676/m.31899 type:complete len:233 (+) Transcript_14676:125-823(+)
MTAAKTEISPESSARICTHMNDDHAATLHAMVVFNLSNREAAHCKVQNAKMMSIGMKEYSISYILCDGDACAMKEITVPFDPPLISSAEARPRLVQDHHKALIPKFTWLVTDPLMRILFGACILLGVGTALGQEELGSRIDDTPWASAIVTAVFGTSARFAKLVVGAWYFSLVAHTMEAFYTAYLCKTMLKMKTGTTFKWFVLNVCTGFPIMNKVQELVTVDSAARSKKKSS